MPAIVTQISAVAVTVQRLANSEQAVTAMRAQIQVAIILLSDLMSSLFSRLLCFFCGFVRVPVFVWRLFVTSTLGVLSPVLADHPDFFDPAVYSMRVISHQNTECLLAHFAASRRVYGISEFHAHAWNGTSGLLPDQWRYSYIDVHGVFFRYWCGACLIICVRVQE